MALTQRELIEAQQRMLRGEKPEPIKKEVSTLSAKEKQQLMARMKAEIIEQVRTEELIPKEAEVTRVIPTKEGYQIEYVLPSPKVPIGKETTVTEQIYEQKRPRLERYSRGMGKQEITFTPAVKPFMEPITKAVSEFGAGLYAIPESWVRPEIPTPIGEGIRRVMGQPTKYETGEVSPFFLAGGVVGTVFESALLSVGVGYAWAGAKRIAPEFLKQPLAKGVARVAQVARVSRVAKVAHKTKLAFQRTVPSFRGSRAEMFLIKRVPFYAKRAARGIARGEVAIPPVPQRIGLADLRAGRLAWELTRVPRTGGVWLGKVGVAPVKTKVLPHLISRAGKISVGYLRQLYYEEPIWKRGLLPFVTQKQVTRMGIVPYIPRAVVSTGKKAVSTLGLGLGIATVAKAVIAPRLVAPQAPRIKRREPLVLLPKVWQPTLAMEREKFRPLTVLEAKAEQKERAIIAPKLGLVQIQPQIVKLKPKLVQRQKQMLAQKIPISPIPSYGKPAFHPFPRGITPSMRGLRARPSLGKWWFRRHPIPTPKIVLETFGLDKRKRKRKKGGVFAWV